MFDEYPQAHTITVASSYSLVQILDGGWGSNDAVEVEVVVVEVVVEGAVEEEEEGAVEEEDVFWFLRATRRTLGSSLARTIRHNFLASY